MWIVKGGWFCFLFVRIRLTDLYLVSLGLQLQLIPLTCSGRPPFLSSDPAAPYFPHVPPPAQHKHSSRDKHMTRCTLSPQVRASHSTQISLGPKEQQGSQAFWNRRKRTPATCGLPHINIFSAWVRGCSSSLRDSNYFEIKRHYYGSSLSKSLRGKRDHW